MSERLPLDASARRCLRRLKPFDVNLHYTDRHRLPAEVEQELGVTFHEIGGGHGARTATS